jgi:hypothetical protein
VHGQKSESLNFERLRRPADRVARRFQPFRSIRTNVGCARYRRPRSRRAVALANVAPRTPPTRPPAPSRRAAGDGKVRQPDIGKGEGIAVERFPTQARKELVRQHTGDEALSTRPFAA